MSQKQADHTLNLPVSHESVGRILYPGVELEHLLNTTPREHLNIQSIYYPRLLLLL